jgi:hypothetical protein
MCDGCVVGELLGGGCLKLSIEGLLSVADQAHLRFSFSPPPTLDFSTIFETICTRTGLKAGCAINQELQSHLSSRKATITRFRVSIISPFINNEQNWSILEWSEENGADGMAIFDVIDEGGTSNCSYLLHYGVKSVPSTRGVEGWNRTSIAWKVSDFGVLKTLFQALQHALGILQLPKADARKLYCNDNPDEQCTTEELSGL